MFRLSHHLARGLNLLVLLCLLLSQGMTTSVAAPAPAPAQAAASTAPALVAQAAPSVPAGLHATGQTDTTITIAWDASADPDVVGYDVSYSNGGEQYSVGPMPDATYTLTGLAPNTSYTITVTAENADGEVSAASDPLVDRTNQAAPTLAIADLAISPSQLTVGATAVISLTVANLSPETAPDVSVALPVPPGSTALPGPGFISASAGWHWDPGDLTAGASTVLTASLSVQSLPPGQVLLANPAIAASGLATQVSQIGELVRPAEPQTTQPFSPGQPATLFNAGHLVRVDFPANGYAQSLTLKYVPPEVDRAQGATVPADAAGFKRGLGVFALRATNGTGNDIHQFDAPLTITVRYFDAQLKARRIEESNLTLYWYDEAQGQWAALPTTVDPDTKTASATVDHFSYYQLGDGSSPSTAFLPSLQGWQVSTFTGAASYAMPIDVPAGPGGLRPQLQLTYNSAETDGDSYKLTHKQSTWVGKGWDLSVPYIALNKAASVGKDYFTLVLNGKTYTIVRGKRLVGAPQYPDTWLQGWEWSAADENFIKIRAVRVGEYISGKQRYKWIVWTKDGMKYEFASDVSWTYQDGTYEGYKWMLTTANDPHQNQIAYQYGVVSSSTSCNRTVQSDIYPTSITWGANRYKVSFESSWRGSQGNAVSHGEDMTWDYADTVCSGPLAAPHQTQKLDRIKVWSMQGSSWQQVRRYDFNYDFSLYSDSSLCTSGSGTCSDTSGTYGPDGTYRKLTLKSVQSVGYDDTKFPVKTAFTYGTTRGTSKRANGGWNRLLTVNNGQGGTLTFGYENISQYYFTCCQSAGYFNLFFNRHRVTSKTLNDGRGNNYTWSYSYGTAAVNTLGTSNGGKGPNQYPNSASLFYWYKNGQPPDTLAITKEREFRGHASTTETLPTGARIEHYFIQGDGSTDTDLENGVSCNPAAASSSDTCFKTMRDRGFQIGQEWKTVWKSSSGATLKAVVHTLASTFYPATVYENEGWPEYTQSGLWRAFTYESQTDEKLYEGGSTPQVKTTTYAYDPAYQKDGQQYGNLTRIDEKGNGTTLRTTQRWFNTRNDETWTWPADNNATVSVNYIVDHKWDEQVSDAGGVVQALTHYFYYDDAMVGASRPDTNVLGKRGLLWRVSRYTNVTPCCSYPLYASDTTYTYDQYGNGTAQTTYPDYGRMASSTSWTAPGNGSTPRTTTYEYDSKFHALVTKVTYPTASGVLLTESADYTGSNNLGFRLGVPTSVIDINGGTTLADYDKFVRLTKIARPGDSLGSPTWQFFYYDDEKPIRYRADLREDSSAVRTLQAFYDGLGREIQTKSESTDTSGSAADIVVDMKYDGLGQIVERSQARYVSPSSAYIAPGASLFNKTSTTYDDLGRMLEVTRPDGTRAEDHHYGVWQASPGVWEQWHVEVDSNRHLTESFYDSFGRFTHIIEFSGNCSGDGSWGYTCGGSYTTGWAPLGMTTYAYTPLDALKQVTDNAGNVTSISYDGLGRKTQMIDPDMGTWYYTYDANGNLTRQRDAKGQRVCFYYDMIDRLTGKQYNGTSDSCPATPTMITYSYDQGTNGAGQRTSMSSLDETTRWVYDARGRKIEATHTVAGLSRTFQWTYDSADRVTRITYPAVGGVIENVDYTYDAGWRATSACSSRGGCYVNNSTRYTALDQPKQLNLGNGVWQRWTYTSPLQRLQQLQIGASSCAGTTCLFDRSYGYDSVSNISSIADNKNGAANSQSFGYDERDRLTTWTLNGVTQSYQYNPLGNLTSKAGKTYSYGDSAHKHAVTNDGTLSYGYDANGNMTSAGGQAYIWNPENQPTSLTGPDGVQELYGYDADGERVKVTRNGVTTIYLEGLWKENASGGASTNLVPNPGFESSGGWTQTPASQYPGTSFFRSNWGTATPHAGGYGYALSNQAYGWLESSRISVGANTQYDLYAWARGEVESSTASGWYVRADFYNSAGTRISSQNAASGGSGSLSSTWQQKGARLTTPAGTASLSIVLIFEMSSGWVAYDDVSLVQVGSSTNLAPNPGFESSGGWTENTAGGYPGTSLYRSNWGTTTPHAGGYSYALSNQAYGWLESSRISASANTQYDLYAWVRGQAQVGTWSGWHIRADFYNSAGTRIGSQDAASGVDGSLITSWQQKGARLTTPAGTASLSILLIFEMSSGWVAYDDVSLVQVGSSTNLAPNPSFESSGGWVENTAGGYPGTSFYRSNWGSAAPHSGSYGYALSNQTYGYLQSDPINVNSNSDYDLYAWVRGNIIEQATGEWLIRAVFYDNAGTYLGQADAAHNGAGSVSTTWQQKGGRIHTPAGATRLSIQLYYYMSEGWVAYDDVSLMQVSGAADAAEVSYIFNGQIVAQRQGSTVNYLHGDHLSSVSLITNGSGAVASQQEFDPWGKVRSGGISQTNLNYTGQRLDGTGLLYYHARYYNPGLGRFISPDSVVPGSASGSMGGIALKPLTVDFHEPGFVATLNAENRQRFWFQMSDDERQKAGSPWGPINPQALNRYSYVQNNPLHYTDPTGHKLRSGPLSREQVGWITEDLNYSGNSGSGLGGGASSLIGTIFKWVGALLGAVTGGWVAAHADAQYTLQKALRVPNGAQYIIDDTAGVYVYDAQGNYLTTVPWQGSIGGSQVAVGAASQYVPIYGADDRAEPPDLTNPQERIGWLCAGRSACGTISDQEKIAHPGDVICARKCYVMPPDGYTPDFAQW